MKPSEILSNEHRVIEQVLNCLETMAKQCQTDGKLDKQSAHEAVDFLRNFADRCHHGKEEEHFFPAMEAKGFSRESGPTGVMFHEHEQGRNYIRSIDESIESAAHGNPSAIKDFLHNAMSYVFLLREHIRKEDHCLFGMADNVFTLEDQQALSEAFEKVETEKMGKGVHGKYIKIADALADRYGVSHTHGENVHGSKPC